MATTGEPFAVSVCHCLDCQRRTGSAFGMQAGFRADQVGIAGEFQGFSRLSDESDRKEHIFRFCPNCGSQVFYTEPSEPDLVVVSVGSFADPSFPPPTESGYESRRHTWIALPSTVQRSSPELWEVGELYDAGRYAEAAGRGRVAIALFPRNGRLLYGVACCESLAGERDAALDHLRLAIACSQDWRERAREDDDFAGLRELPAFTALIAG